MAGAHRFSVGDRVHVALIGKGVVRDVRNGGRYLVEVKGRHMVAAEAQLTRGEDRKPPTAAVDGRGAEPQPPDPETAPPSRAAAALDLHGLTTDEASSALEAFLSDAILAGAAEVRVIHGRSGGRLKAAVHARLKVITAVRGFYVDRTNAGVTVVIL